jgi:hypothetical protein
MTNRIDRSCGAMSDLSRANITLAFCDAIWQLHSDPNALQDWEIESLCRLENEAAAVLREWRIALLWSDPSIAEGRAPN